MRLGIRVQLGAALAVLLLFALVPLYVAVANLTRASMASVRESSARALGRSIAAHVGEAASARRDDASVAALLDAQLGQGGVAAVGVYGKGGARARTAGEVGALPRVIDPTSERLEAVETSHGRAVLVAMPGEGPDVSAVAVVVRTDDSTTPTGPLVRLFALYTAAVGVALLVFSYFALTRLVVRPVDRLTRAARKVAGGARTLEPPKAAARELAELGEDLARMTERLRADEEELRARVDEATRHAAEIERAQEQVVRSERLASVGRLSAGLAHEIGNPISAILGFEELLLAGDLPPEEQRDFVERMKKETERIHRVLRDLLDFARPAVASGPASGAASGDVGEAARDVAALVKPQKGFRDIELEVDVAPDVPRVAIAEERVVQVLLNLLLNAADATNGRGRVALRASRDAAGARVEVEDDGPGV
ncbi:MAG TPA: histidine kinase dimerization/phospho-acceptor domain-containing protein, partial [Byssovorax sp.]